LELHGTTRLGIFRLGGNAKKLEEIMEDLRLLVSEQVDGEDEMRAVIEPHKDDLHTIANLLKTYLHRQKEHPLIPQALYGPLMEASELSVDLKSRLEEIKKILSRMPEANRIMLERLVKMFRAIAANSQENRMDYANLAIMFGATLFKMEGEAHEMIFKLRRQCLILEDLMRHYSVIFLGMESEETNEQEQPPAKSPAHPEDNEDQGEEPDMDRLAKEMEEAEKEDCSGEECVGIPINEPASPRQQEEPATSVDEATEHEFEKEFFSPFSPVMCKYCKKFIYTIRKAYSCKRCKYPAHKNCKKKAGKSCRPGWDMQHTKKPPVAVGDKAPLFILNDGNGMPYSLKHSIAMKKKVIIFFYPKDFTPGCVRENKAFRDQFSLFQYADCEIVGISADTMSCHQKFAEKYNIPFRLLSDPKNLVRKLYGVPDSLGGLAPGRVTYVLDQNGVVAHIFNSLWNPEEHLVHSLYAVSQLLLRDIA